jgi:glucose-1-phosphate thymidylyltransferase
MKGIILAGGTGSRLWPLTIPTSKQLLPIYDKPLIYYPISTLMLAGIREIQIITTPQDQDDFKALLGDGTAFGVRLSYATQPKPEGLAQAFLICEDFLQNQNCALILGDNLFDGAFQKRLNFFDDTSVGGQIFAYKVSNPKDYGVVSFDENGKAIDIQEKPDAPKSSYAVPGIYFYDSTVVQRAKSLKPSPRGELEITDLNLSYLLDGLLTVHIIPQGSAWLDTGTFETMNDASNYVRVLEDRQGQKIGCLEEIAWKNGWIDDKQLVELSIKFSKNDYGKYLANLLNS